MKVVATILMIATPFMLAVALWSSWKACRIGGSRMMRAWGNPYWPALWFWPPAWSRRPPDLDPDVWRHMGRFALCGFGAWVCWALVLLL
ncbi:MAG TPA: hypothetical protein VN329_15970, partial [Roseomonas sp.]|nr:hypothetical protein [Roseomonas sp.]